MSTKSDLFFDHIRNDREILTKLEARLLPILVSCRKSNLELDPKKLIKIIEPYVPSVPNWIKIHRNLSSFHELNLIRKETIQSLIEYYITETNLGNYDN